MSRSIATCKKCGTQFAMVGEVDGCVQCGHPELAVQPEPGDWKELAKMAEDMSNEDIDAFMATLSKEYSQTQKFIAELEAEFDMDQAVRELMEDFDPTPAERTQMAKSKEEWSKEPHHEYCCCDKCAPTKEEREKRAADFDRQTHKADCICDDCCVASLRKAAQSKQNPKLQGNCRTCAIWNKLAPQAGSCQLMTEAGPVTEAGVRVTMWFETCPSYRFLVNYKAQQIEIREKRKAHHSIIRAMERNS